jgi:hypothetical protein
VSELLCGAESENAHSSTYTEAFMKLPGFFGVGGELDRAETSRGCKPRLFKPVEYLDHTGSRAP